VVGARFAVFPPRFSQELERLLSVEVFSARVLFSFTFIA